MVEVSEKFLEYGIRSSKKGKILNPDGYAQIKGECGDTISYFIRIDGDNISEIKYEIDGCINSNACANAMIDLSEGKTIKEVMSINPGSIIEFLETLPKNEHHCADMVVDAIRSAVKDHFARNSNSWKKQYL